MKTDGNVQGKDLPSIIMEETNKTQNSGTAPIQEEDTPSTSIEETNKIENSGSATRDFGFSPMMDKHNLNATLTEQPKGTITISSSLTLTILPLLITE